MQGAKMIGPLLGGLLLARLGPAPCYLALAGLSLGALAAAHRLDRRIALPGAATSEPILASLTAGLREVRGRPVILGVLAITVLMNALVSPISRSCRSSPVTSSGWGRRPRPPRGGERASGPSRRRWRSRRARATCITPGSSRSARWPPRSSCSRSPWSPWYALSLALQLAIGAAESGFGTMQSAIVLLAAPERARGRAMGILSACIGTQPLGSLWIGFLASRAALPSPRASTPALAFVLMIPVAIRLVASAATAARRPA